MSKAAIYALGGQLGLSEGAIDDILTAKLERSSRYSRSIMTANLDFYKAGTHYGTVTIYDFK
ncbi:MAG: hypothetical protein JW771_05870 [Candidatus Thermoplasmatota archaeon]|nr:hypothetical protein [Candidatus Thermoplasmatota archaeon]